MLVEGRYLIFLSVVIWRIVEERMIRKEIINLVGGDGIYKVLFCIRFFKNYFLIVVFNFEFY